MLLGDVKAALGITVQDESVNMSILLKIQAVKGFLQDAGAVIEEPVPPKMTECIAIGVNDLLNNQGGETKFSPAFILLAKQICR